jgi:hypothetical protein
MVAVACIICWIDILSDPGANEDPRITLEKSE